MSQHGRVEGYEVSSDEARLDLDVVHAYLSSSYWSPGIPRSLLARGIANSLCFGVYHASGQVGFARVMTDRATFAYLADVFILEAHRGQGLAKWLMEFIMAHEYLQGLRVFMLRTRDAHGLYERFGFSPLANPAGAMEIKQLNLYSTT